MLIARVVVLALLSTVSFADAATAQQRITQQAPWTLRAGVDEWGERDHDQDLIQSPPARPRTRAWGRRSVTATASIGPSCLVILLARGDGILWLVSGLLDLDTGASVVEIRIDNSTVVNERNERVVDAEFSMILNSRRHFGLAIRSEETLETLAFEWLVTDPDRTLLRETFPQCIKEPFE